MGAKKIWKQLQQARKTYQEVHLQEISIFENLTEEELEFITETGDTLEALITQYLSYGDYEETLIKTLELLNKM